jgi:hypothetical protein
MAGIVYVRRAARDVLERGAAVYSLSPDRRLGGTPRTPANSLSRGGGRPPPSASRPPPRAASVRRPCAVRGGRRRPFAPARRGARAPSAGCLTGVGRARLDVVVLVRLWVRLRPGSCCPRPMGRAARRVRASVTCQRAYGAGESAEIRVKKSSDNGASDDVARAPGVWSCACSCAFAGCRAGGSMRGAWVGPLNWTSGLGETAAPFPAGDGPGPGSWRSLPGPAGRRISFTDVPYPPASARLPSRAGESAARRSRAPGTARRGRSTCCAPTAVRRLAVRLPVPRARLRTPSGTAARGPPRGRSDIVAVRTYEPR